MSISKTKYTSQYIDNMSFDDQTKVKVTEIMGADGVLKNPATEETLASTFAKKITAPDANTTYIAIAPIGSTQSASVWQCKKILVSGNDTVITWADGDSKFDNVATDLTALTYS